MCHGMTFTIFHMHQDCEEAEVVLGFPGLLGLYHPIQLGIDKGNIYILPAPPHGTFALNLEILLKSKEALTFLWNGSINMVCIYIYIWYMSYKSFVISSRLNEHLRSLKTPLLGDWQLGSGSASASTLEHYIDPITPSPHHRSPCHEPTVFLRLTTSICRFVDD